MKPVLLLETRTSPIMLLTSRSLVIKSITSKGIELEFCYTHQEIQDQVCYGQSYMVLEDASESLVINTLLGEEEIKYVFKL